MNYAKYVFLALTALILSACGNGIGASQDGSKFSLSGVDGQNADDTTINDGRPLIRAHFDAVFSATVQRRAYNKILPMIACRVDDSNNCQPPIYKEVVNVHIDGTGSAGDDQRLSPIYFQSLSVDFALEVQGSRRCLDQAIDAIAKNASLDIAGYGSYSNALAGEGGTVSGGSGGTVSGGPAVQTQGTTSNDRPIWAGFTNVAFEVLKACEVTERTTHPPVIDPLPPVESQPAEPARN